MTTSSAIRSTWTRASVATLGLAALFSSVNAWQPAATTLRSSAACRSLLSPPSPPAADRRHLCRHQHCQRCGTRRRAGGVDDNSEEDQNGRYMRERRSLGSAKLREELAAIEQANAKVKSFGDAEEAAPIGGRREDLEGVDPILCFAGSLMSAGVSFGAWKATAFLLVYFAEHGVSDNAFYVVQRITVLVRTFVLATCALGSCVAGINAVGLLGLGARVSYALATGEFDEPVSADDTDSAAPSDVPGK